jgi:hypothetical protein
MDTAVLTLPRSAAMRFFKLKKMRRRRKLTLFWKHYFGIDSNSILYKICIPMSKLLKRNLL